MLSCSLFLGGLGLNNIGCAEVFWRFWMGEHWFRFVSVCVLEGLGLKNIGFVCGYGYGCCQGYGDVCE